MKKYLLFLGSLWCFAACTVSNKNDLDKDVKVFLMDFNNKLNQSDEVIWKQFMTLQNKEEIFKVIRILQNRESKNITTEILYDEASTKFEDGMLSVEAPVIIRTLDEVIESQIAMGLFRKDSRLYVANVKGENLYTQFFAYKREEEGKVVIGEIIKSLKPYYEKAKELQKKYDSVIWFVKHKGVEYYYVVNGRYGVDSLTDNNKGLYKMGLVDEKGKEIVPVEYDLIGTPSISLPGMIEVKRHDKIGYYSLDGKELLPPEYTWLVPYNENETIAILREDSSYFWVDKNFILHKNFPSIEAKEQILDYKYLSQNKLTIGRDYQDLIHVINPEFLNSEFIFRIHGLIVPPNYYVKQGIFGETIGGFILWERDYNRGFDPAGNVFIENSNDQPFGISETLKAFVSNFKTRFVGGRGEFYTSHVISLKDKNDSIISTIDTYGFSDFTFRRINDKLFESKFQYEPMEPDEILEQNFPGYNYFSFDGKKLTELESNRRFRFTQFVKIDSSYLKGDFETLDLFSENWKKGKSNFVSKKTIEAMRDEILASYGFVFPEGHPNSFSNYGWYKAYTSSYDEVYRIASEIDKYNLDFLTKLVGKKPWTKPV